LADYCGTWDCRYCGTKKIWAYNRSCSGCGRPRAADTRFYMPADAPIITEEMKKFFGGGPDWYCSSCDTSNMSDTNKCENCGAPRGIAQQHQIRVYEKAPQSDEETKELEPSARSVSSSAYEPPDDVYNPPIHEVREESSYVYQPATITSTDFDKSRNYLKIGLISAGALILIILGFLFFNTHKVNAVVSGFSWNQTVQIEEYQTFHESGWSIPAGGRETHSETRQSGWRTVTDGYRSEPYTDTCYQYVSKTCYQDNGNGSFSSVECGGNESYSCTKYRDVPITHQEPVYDTWYEYDIDRWAVISSHPTSGEDHEAYYDSAKANGDLQRRVEIPGTYTVFFSCDEVGNFSRTYNYSEWLNFNYEQTHEVTTNVFKAILKVE